MKVNQAKEKVAAKVAKGKAKVAAKCGKAAKCVALLFCLAFALTGCQNPAQRSITITTEIYAYDKSQINVGGQGDVGSAAQSNETGGNDAGMTASPTNDIKPDIDVSIPVNKANAGTSGASMGALESVLGAGADWLGSKIKGSGDAKATDAAPAATSATAAPAASNAGGGSCPGGNCSTCTDGSCSPGGACTDGSCSLK